MFDAAGLFPGVSSTNKRPYKVYNMSAKLTLNVAPIGALAGTRLLTCCLVIQRHTQHP